MTEHPDTNRIILQTATIDAHFEGILQLQKQNLYKLISVEQQQLDGFVFAEHNLDLLRAMAGHLPQVIALYNDKVVGYTLAMTSGMDGKSQGLASMFEEFKKCNYAGKPLSDYRFMIGGQVCVDQNFRGQRLLSRLYHEIRNLISPEYQLCVTEISDRNIVSLKAHEKMGFEVIRSYRDDKELWHIVVWDMRK